MKKSILFLLFILSFISIKGQGSYPIVYMADPETIIETIGGSYPWLHNIKHDWSATGINLVIKWGKALNTNRNSNNKRIDSLYWSQIRSAMKVIADSSMDVYIRINMNRLPPTYQAYTDANYFQYRQNGGYYYSPYYSGTEKLFNYTYSQSKVLFVDFVRKVVDTLNSYSLPVRTRIKIIIPTLSADDESEYTTHCSNGSVDIEESSGYSIPELDAFRSFLETRYSNNIVSLRAKWGDTNSTITDFYYIISTNGMKNTTDNWNWHSITWDQSLSSIKFSAGRKDWLDFKEDQLKTLLKSFADIIKPSFNFGLQFSSLEYSDRAGRYDVTPILDHMGNELDLIIEDNTPHGKPGFDFVSNLARSICKYLSLRNRSTSNPVKFGTETNWMDIYNEPTSPNFHSDWTDWPNFLADSWKAQVDASQFFGGSVLFISHWGTEEMPFVKDTIKAGGGKTRYSLWLSDLQTIRSYGFNDIFSTYMGNEAGHVSLLQGLYRRDGFLEGKNYERNYNIYTNLNILSSYPNGIPDGIADYEYQYNYGETVSNSPHGFETWIFPAEKFFFPSTEYYGNAAYSIYSYSSKKQLLKADVLTDYMIENPYISVTPYNYIQKHGAVFFTADSYYLSDVARQNIINTSHYYENATYNPSVGYCMVDVGVRNEYNQSKPKLYKQSNKTYSMNSIPSKFELNQNYPNPFNPSTLISYSLPQNSFVTLKVYDILGREVGTLVDEFKLAGKYEVEFNASKLTSGLYIFRISSGNFQDAKKMVLMK